MKIPHDIQLDTDQLKVAAVLQQLSQNLTDKNKDSISQRLSSFFKGPSTNPIQGVYIHGSVGRGKTMLMDAFFTDVKLEKKQRWHFHAFMQQVHQRLQAIRKNTAKGSDDQPIVVLAKEIQKNVRLLCFDEFHVTDIADAMILGRLFTKLFELGVVVVSTSNQHPDELYAGGLHRDRFLPFIKILKKAVPEIELDGPVDYRRQLLQQHRRYLTPLNETSHQEMTSLYNELKGDHPETSVELTVNGRSLKINHVANGMALMNFSQLCEQPLGAPDYLCLADNFHTVFIENVPVMKTDMYNEARRFMTLIDILYDREINLVLSAEDRPDQLYTGDKNKELFTRAVSRLIEMTGG